jgi:phosphosulfolactate synthase
MNPDLPERIKKKRQLGITCLLDNGIGNNLLTDYLYNCSSYVDVAKIGWGTAMVSKIIDDKVDIYKKFDIEVSLGGTLFEYFCLKSKTNEYISYAKELNTDIVEISDGTINMTRAEKLRYIERFKKHFKVFSEVGSKDVEFVTSPAKWVKWIQEELDAGADYVILEGRESGTAGLFRQTGEIRMGLVNEIVESGIPTDSLIFETPKKHQQVWFIKRFGHNVNLANIAIENVISLETLRLGLRSDTLMHFHDPKS